MAKLKLVGLADEMPTPFDGQYVVEYDPNRNGTDPHGEPMICHLVTTADPEKALDVPANELFELWRKPKAGALRWDGAPERPLTAFNIEIQ